MIISHGRRGNRRDLEVPHPFCVSRIVRSLENLPELAMLWIAGVPGPTIGVAAVESAVRARKVFQVGQVAIEVAVVQKADRIEYARLVLSQ